MQENPLSINFYMQLFITKNHQSATRPLVSATSVTLGHQWNSSRTSCCCPVLLSWRSSGTGSIGPVPHPHLHAPSDQDGVSYHITLVPGLGSCRSSSVFTNRTNSLTLPLASSPLARISSPAFTSLESENWCLKDQKVTGFVFICILCYMQMTLLWKNLKWHKRKIKW